MSMSKKVMLIWTVERLVHQSMHNKPQFHESYSSKEPNNEKVGLLVEKVNKDTYDVVLSMNVEDDPSVAEQAKNALVNVWSMLAITREAMLALKKADYDYDAASRKEECDLVAICREASNDVFKYVKNGGKLVTDEEETEEETVETEETEEEDSTATFSLGETYDMDSNTQVFTIDCSKN